MDERKLIIICAQQRSGTTALQRALGNLPDIQNCSEVFHEAGLTTRTNYFCFLKDRPDLHNLLAYPSDANRKHIFKSYIAHVFNCVKQTYPLLDIKYNSWHHFNRIWSVQIERPYLLDLLKQAKMPIIHIKRRNVLMQYISLIYADRIKAYHFSGDDAAVVETTKNATDSFRIVIKDCVEKITLYLELQKLFSSFLEEYSHCVELYYEDLFSGAVLNDSAAKEIRSIIPIPVRPISTDLVKTPFDATALIENKQEIIRALAGTQFEAMALEAFSDK